MMLREIFILIGILTWSNLCLAQGETYEQRIIVKNTFGDPVEKVYIKIGSEGEVFTNKEGYCTIELNKSHYQNHCTRIEVTYQSFLLTYFDTILSHEVTPLNIIIPSYRDQYDSIRQLQSYNITLIDSINSITKEITDSIGQLSYVITQKQQEIDYLTYQGAHLNSSTDELRIRLKEANNELSITKKNYNFLTTLFEKINSINCELEINNYSLTEKTTYLQNLDYKLGLISIPRYSHDTIDIKGFVEGSDIEPNFYIQMKVFSRGGIIKRSITAKPMFINYFDHPQVDYDISQYQNWNSTFFIQNIADLLKLAKRKRILLYLEFRDKTTDQLKGTSFLVFRRSTKTFYSIDSYKQ